MWWVVRPLVALTLHIFESELALHERLSDEQKAKQLGFADHPVFTYRTAEMLKEATNKVWGFPTQT